MNAAPVPVVESEPAAKPSRWRGLNFFSAAEDTAFLVLFGLIMLLPIVEMALRPFGAHLQDSSALVQHGCLVAGMLGGVVAARQGKLLSISALPLVLKGRAKIGASVIANAVGGSISAVLFWYALRYLLVERADGKTISYGIPVWLLQASMPAGFALIALRLAFPAGYHWRQHGMTVAGALALFLFFDQELLPENVTWWAAVVTLFFGAILGAPIFTLLAGSAMLLYWMQGENFATLPLDQYRLVVNTTVPAIPLFTLAGYFLAEGGAAPRLLRLCQAAVGHLRGGAAIVTVCVCALFTAFTGASGVTILALGGLLMPLLLQSGFPARSALGMVTSAGSLGLLFPPCLPLMLYAIVASNSGSFIEIRQMFVAGFLPGIVLMLLTICYGVCRSQPAAGRQFSARELRSAFWEAKWELLVPVVAVGALLFGLATPVEAAAITAAYTLFIEMVVHRGLRPRDLPRVVSECGILVGGVLLILGIALGLTSGFVEAQVPDKLMAWAEQWIDSRWLFLLALNLFLLLAGCLMDVFSAIVVLVPLIAPLAQAYGIHPLHLGVVFLANLEIGFLTPPVGMNLFLSSYRFNKPVLEVSRAVLPLLGLNLIALLLITYLPALSLWLPSFFAAK
jgi:C4-dicarboxylate transporter, DctM subunit